MPDRIKHGAYRFNKPLAEFMQQADAAELGKFYEFAKVVTPRLLGALKEAGSLVEAELRLKEKVAALF